MADKKISELVSLTGANAATGDLLPIVDISATETKKITRDEFFKSIPSIDVTGNIAVGGTVDGRDVAADGSKLDGIEAGADVTDTANVTAAGALMDSEVTNLAAVKAFDPADYATAAQGSLADTALQDGDTVASLTITSADINGGTIDGTVIGGTTPAAISGTTGSFSGNLTVDTNTLFVDAANNRVGVGTVSPASFTPSTLVVEAATTAGITISDSTGGGTASIAFSATGAFQNIAKINCTMSSQSLEFSTATSERMRIDSSGNLGLGTASPDAKLHVVGPAASLRVGFLGGSSNFYDADLQVFRSGNGTERARITSTGSVGLGTVSPEANLHVQNGSAGSITTTNSQLLIENNTTARLTLLTPNTNGATIEFGDPEDQDAGRINYDHAGNFMRLFTAGEERLRITSTGSVGIGTANPVVRLQAETSGAGIGTVARFLRANGAETHAIQFNIDPDAKVSEIRAFGSTNGSLSFATNNTERARIDASGNLLVGTTITDLHTTSTETGSRIADGFAMLSRSGGEPLYLNRLTSDGGILQFRKNGTVVGSIGADGGRITLASSSRTWFWGSSNYFVNVDNVVDLGTPSFRFDDVYATNGTIQTSDRNEKQDIEALSDAEQRVAVACKGLLRKFRWKSAVEEKGDDARIHFGIIAQDLQAAFEAEGLDAGRYAMFISSTWTDEETGEERSRMGVRYPQLLAFIIAAI